MDLNSSEVPSESPTALLTSAEDTVRTTNETEGHPALATIVGGVVCSVIATVGFGFAGYWGLKQCGILGWEAKSPESSNVNPNVDSSVEGSSDSEKCDVPQTVTKNQYVPLPVDLESGLGDKNENQQKLNEVSKVGSNSEEEQAGEYRWEYDFASRRVFM